jgi:glutamate synthase domain-containing protein 3
MTGGIAVILGQTGRNFAAGMSGGIAYVRDEDRKFKSRCNLGMVDLEQITLAEDFATLKDMITRHAELTGSPRAAKLLADWENEKKRFVKVFPHEYRRVLGERAKKQQGVPVGV